MKVGVIGCGAMGGALARHFAKNNQVLVCDHHQQRCQQFAKQIGATFYERAEDLVKDADFVVLAVKPKDLGTVAQATAAAFSKGKPLFSVLAGTNVALLKQHFPKATAIRSMPNLALTCGQGVIGLVEDPSLSPEVVKMTNALLEGIGLVTWLSESKIEALTSLAASGIGMVFVIIEALIDGGVFLGFSAQESKDLVLKVLEGSVALMRESGKHPAELKLQVASPAGTTIEGLKVMEEKGIRAGIVSALEASYKKGLTLLKT